MDRKRVPAQVYLRSHNTDNLIPWTGTTRNGRQLGILRFLAVIWCGKVEINIKMACSMAGDRNDVAGNMHDANDVDPLYVNPGLSRVIIFFCRLTN